MMHITFTADCSQRGKGCLANYINKKIDLDLPSPVFIAQRLVGQSKQLKQIIQIDHNIVKNPNWPEAN